MKRSQLLTVLLCTVLVMPAVIRSQEKNTDTPTNPPLSVTQAVFCIAVIEREPAGEDAAFPPNVGKVYFMTTIEGAENPTTIHHVWYHQDQQTADVTLDIQYPRHRTWSYKTILPEWTGEWAVEVHDNTGNVIEKKTFIISPIPEKQITPAPAEETPELKALPKDPDDE